MKKLWPILILLTLFIPLYAGGSQDDLNEPEVFEYIDRGDVDGLTKYLLSDKSEVNKANSLGNYPLHSAVEKNSHQMTLLLLNSLSEIDAVNKNRETPLLLAAKKDNRELVDLFLKWDADPSLSDSTGSYPLHYGVKNNDLIIVQELIPVMSDIDIPDGDGKSALLIAVDSGLKEVAAYLTEEGADIYFESPDGDHPAELLIEKDNLDLLKSVINVNNFDLSFDQPYPLLHLATDMGRSDLCEYLIELNRKALDISDAEGRLPIDIALSYKQSYQHAQIARYFVNQGSKRSRLREFSYVSDLFRNDNVTQDMGDGVTPLHNGAMMGHEALVSLMIDSFQPNLDVKDSVGGTPLLYAVRGGHETIVTLLLDGGANVNSTNNYEITPIQAAIGLNNYNSMLDLLVSRGGNINQQDIHGNTALHLATEYNLEIGVVEKLIQLGMNPNIRNSEGSIPLIYGLKELRTDIITFLTPLSDIYAINRDNQSAVLLALSQDMGLMNTFFTPDNLASQDVEGNSPLHYAATYPLDELVKEKMVFMVNMGSDPNLRNARGMTPLHSALESYYWQTANTLCGLGSDMYLANNSGETALHMAFIRGSDFTMRFLTEGENLLENTDLAGNSPLFHSISGFHTSILKLLLERNVQVNHVNSLGETPIFLAVEENALDAVELLLDAGADLNLLDKSGNSLMHFLVHKDKINWMVGDLLIEEGLNPDTKNIHGLTPLHRAAEYGSLEGCTYLMEKGVTLDPVDKNGYTPLFYAVITGSQEIASYLLEQGAGINKRDIRGNTVLHASILQSIEQNNEDLIQVLLDWKGDIFAKNKIGDTPLSLAMEVGPVTLDHLMRDDTINSVNNEGNTPLHYALLLKADPAIVESLLSEGADKYALNGNGETPLEIGERMFYQPYIIELLGQ